MKLKDYLNESKSIYVETKVRGMKIEASFEAGPYSYSEERSNRKGDVRIIKIYLVPEDMPKNKKEAKKYVEETF